MPALRMSDIAARLGPDGKQLAMIAEVLSKQYEEMFQDALWEQSNKTTSHLITRRTSQPTGTWGRINKGIQSERSTTVQLEEAMGMLESESHVDERLLRIQSNPTAFRQSEDIAHVDGLGHTVATEFIYGDGGDGFKGLATRYNALSQDSVYDNGGTGSDLTSIWIVQWGDRQVHMIYPKGSRTGGITAEDRGRWRVPDANSDMYWAWITYFYFHLGLAVWDDACVARIANIEASGTGANQFNEDILIQALNNMPMRGAGAVIYSNRDILTQAEIRAKDKTNVSYTQEEAFGGTLTRFKGRPWKLIDAITATETAVA